MAPAQTINQTAPLTSSATRRAGFQSPAELICRTLRLCVFAVLTFNTVAAQADWQPALEKIVKIYGTGGMQGLEAYQTGIAVSDAGHILTVNSLVLDSGEVTVITSTGSQYSGEVLGADPTLEVAVVKIDPAGDTLPYYSLRRSNRAAPGEPIYALANIFGIATGDEPVSAQHGVIATIAPLRTGRGPRGATLAYGLDGQEAYLLDAVTSNPGAAGGALIDHRGRLLGMLGPELKSRTTGTWISYALPTDVIAPSVQRIIAGEKMASSQAGMNNQVRVNTLRAFGFQLVPDIVARTPPYVDFVDPESQLAEAGLKPDDLIISVDGMTTASTTALRRALSNRDPAATLQLLIERAGEFVEIELAPTKQ